MVVVEYTIDAKDLTKPIRILPFGCVHADDPGFHRHLFQQFVESALSSDQTVVIGMGDYHNFLRGTARKHLKSYVEDENSFEDLDTLVKNRAREFYLEWLKPIENRLLGLAEGNHYHEYMNRTTDTQTLCELAGCYYLDKPAFVRLRITNNGKALKVFKILIHHGDWSGGYSRIGGDLNSIENKGVLGFSNFDIFLFGHTHRKGGFKAQHLDITKYGEPKVIEIPKVFIRTGCFVAGYDQKCIGGYVQKKLMPPTELGWVELQIVFYREYDKKRTQERVRRLGKHTGGVPSNYKYDFRVIF